MALLIVSVGYLALYSVTGANIRDFCDGTFQIENEGLNAYLKTARVKIAEIDQSYSNTVGKYMCTDFCACVKPDFKMWPSAQHIEFKKTKAQGGVYNFNGTYENFFDCYDDKKILFAQL